MCTDNQYVLVIMPDILCTLRPKYITARVRISFSGQHYIDRQYVLHKTNDNHFIMTENGEFPSFRFPLENFHDIDTLQLSCDIYEEYSHAGIIYDVAVRSFICDYSFIFSTPVLSQHTYILPVSITADVYTIDDLPREGNIMEACILNGYTSLYGEQDTIWFDSINSSGCCLKKSEREKILSFCNCSETVMKDVFRDLPAEVARSIVYINRKFTI